MSEADPAPGSALEPEIVAAKAEPTSFGARLAWHREKAGLSISDVASRLRLSANHVRAMEAEDLSVLPVLPYVRGFVRSYAKIVGIDPTPLLEQLTPQDAERTAQRATGGGLPGPTDGRLMRRVVVIAAVLVLLTLGAIGWQTTSRPPLRSAVVEASPPVAKPAVAPTTEAAQPIAAAGGPTVATAAVAIPVAESERASSAVVDANEAAAPVAVASVDPGPSSTANLSLIFDGDCWVEVTAANGRVVYSQLHAAGSQADIDAPMPLTVVLGDASKARVAVRGKPFDVAPHLRQNVARFTVDR